MIRQALKHWLLVMPLYCVAFPNQFLHFQHCFMIDLVQYRFHIGTFVGKVVKCSGKGNLKSKYNDEFSVFSAFNPYNRPAPIIFYGLDDGTGLGFENLIHSPHENTHISFLYIFYLYFISIIMSFMLSILSSPFFY